MILQTVESQYLFGLVVTGSLHVVAVRFFPGDSYTYSQTTDQEGVKECTEPGV